MTQLLASGHTSLMHGWLPMGLQVVTALVLTLAIGWRSRRWRAVWLPAAVAVGGAVAFATHWYIVDHGLSDEPAPPALWIWIALTGAAAAVAVLGWDSARPWRRGATVLAVGRSTTTPNASTESAATRPIASPKMLCLI